MFLGGLFLATLAPPVDVTWLKDLFQEGGALGGLEVVDERFVIATTTALGNVPPCALAVGLESLARSDFRLAAQMTFWLLFGAAVGFAVAFWLLVRFYRGTARPARPRDESVTGTRRARDGAFWALIDREASDFVRNPKARLLVGGAVLPVHPAAPGARPGARPGGGGGRVRRLAHRRADELRRAGGGRELRAERLAPTTARGWRFSYASPVPLRALFVAKNLVHAAGTLVAGGGAHRLLLHLRRGPRPGGDRGGPAGAGGGAAGAARGGQRALVVAPRKFHASLRRRDRPPAVATFVGLLATAVAVAPLALSLRLLGAAAPGAGTLAALAAVRARALVRLHSPAAPGGGAAGAPQGDGAAPGHARVALRREDPVTDGQTPTPDPRRSPRARRGSPTRSSPRVRPRVLHRRRPGGQHRNKTETGVRLRHRPPASWSPPPSAAPSCRTAARRSSGWLRAKLLAFLPRRQEAQEDQAQRRARRRRLEGKRRQGEKKRERKSFD
jgi:hypothetical protein